MARSVSGKKLIHESACSLSVPIWVPASPASRPSVDNWGPWRVKDPKNVGFCVPNQLPTFLPLRGNLPVQGRAEKALPQAPPSLPAGHRSVKGTLREARAQILGLESGQEQVR